MLRPPGAASSESASPLIASLQLAFLLLLIAAPAGAKTFVIPHIIEAKGHASSSPYTFDTTIFITYGEHPGATGMGATADVYLYDNSGSPMQSQTATDVCNPCSFALGGIHPRKHSVSVEDALVAAGDFATIKLGFAVIVVSGSDENAVAVQGHIVNSHTSAFDVSIAPVTPNVTGGAGGGGGGSARVFVLPHVFEAAGRTSNTQYTFDTTVFMTYTGGLAGAPAGAGAAADLYLLDDSGAYLNGGGGTPVCAPCSFGVDDVTRKQSIGLETFIEAAGGFGGSSVLSGYAVLEVDGDVDHVSSTAFVVNSHTSAFDVSVFGFNPQEITAPARVALEPGNVAPSRVALSVSPNPVHTPGEGVGLAFDLPAAGAVELAIHDVNGREIVKLASASLAAGTHRMHWDGRDAAGAPVRAGVYFARLTEPSGLVASRIVAIR